MAGKVIGERIQEVSGKPIASALGLATRVARNARLELPWFGLIWN